MISRIFTGEYVDKAGGKSVCIVKSEEPPERNGKYWLLFMPFDRLIPTVQNRPLRSGMRAHAAPGKILFECFRRYGLAYGDFTLGPFKGKPVHILRRNAG